jgi:hypothetical protein
MLQPRPGEAGETALPTAGRQGCFSWFSARFFLRCDDGAHGDRLHGSYPLVNVYIIMEHHHAING